MKSVLTPTKKNNAIKSNYRAVVGLFIVLAVVGIAMWLRRYLFFFDYTVTKTYLEITTTTVDLNDPKLGWPTGYFLLLDQVVKARKTTDGFYLVKDQNKMLHRVPAAYLQAA